MGTCCPACQDNGRVVDPLEDCVLVRQQPLRSQGSFFADPDEVTPEEDALGRPKDIAAMRRMATADLIHAPTEEDDIIQAPLRSSSKRTRDLEDLTRKSAYVASDIATALATGHGAERDKPDIQEILKEVERLVDVEYDVLLADMLLRQLEQRLPPEQLEHVMQAPVIRRMHRKFHYMEIVGKACCSQDEGWFSVYKDGPQSIEGLFDTSDGTILHYKARVTIPVSLKSALAVANEVELLPTWNKLVVDTPKVFGRRTAHYMVLNYQMSFSGLYKLDILNEIRRFSDPDGGILVEYIRSADRDHPCYKEPASGFKRPMTELKNVWIACGEGCSVLIQVGKVKLPFQATTWLAKTVGAVAGRFIVGGLINNSMRATEPNNVWEEHVQEDRLGFYARIAELVGAPGSASRKPPAGESVPQFKDTDLEPYFRKGRRRSRVVTHPDESSYARAMSYQTMNMMAPGPASHL